MLLYIARRLMLAVAIVMLAVTLLFVMIHSVPGDPASVILGPRSTAEQRALIHERMGLDQPLPVQIVSFFGDVVRGDFGTDIFTQRPVSRIVFGELPHTLALIFASITWAVLVGIPLGCYSAVRRNSIIDKFIGVFSVSTIAIPSFVMAVYSLLIFAVLLGWLPAIGAGDGGFWDGVQHLILPAFAVGVGWVGYISRIVRASMLEVLGESHVRMARAFGLSELRIILRYALNLAILPTVTVLGVGMAHLLSASVFAEVVFARPGIGALIVNAVDSRNYPVVMGTVLVTTVLFVISTTAADLINAALDPQVRESL